MKKKIIDFKDHFETQSSTINEINKKSQYSKKKFFF